MTSFTIAYIEDPRTGFKGKQIQVLNPKQVLIPRQSLVSSKPKSSISIGKIATLAILAFLLILPFVFPPTQAKTSGQIAGGVSETR